MAAENTELTRHSLWKKCKNILRDGLMETSNRLSCPNRLIIFWDDWDDPDDHMETRVNNELVWTDDNKTKTLVWSKIQYFISFSLRLKRILQTH